MDLDESNSSASRKTRSKEPCCAVSVGSADLPDQVPHDIKVERMQRRLRTATTASARPAI